MFGLSEILALAIGLFFVYLLLSAITNYITQTISYNILRLSSKNLADAIQNLFEPSTELLNGQQRLKASLKEPGEGLEHSTNLQTNFFEAFYSHPIIRSLSKPHQLPSYISAQDFSITLLDLLIGSRQNRLLTPQEYLGELKNNLDCLNEDMRRTLLPLIEYAEVIEVDPEKRIAQVRQKIEDWYSTTIDRSFGWYKTRVQAIGILVGFLIASVLNADTINIVHSLWSDTAVRQGLVQAAQEYNQQNDTINYQKVLYDLGNLKFPLGWSPLKTENDDQAASSINGDVVPASTSINGNNDPSDPYRYLKTPSGALTKLVGLLITALAISIGSTIWFDILNRVINLRSTGDRPQNSP
jgi:hypothetical protein